MYDYMYDVQVIKYVSIYVVAIVPVIFLLCRLLLKAIIAQSDKYVVVRLL